MTTVPEPAPRQTLKERLNSNKCAVLDCPEAAYNEIILDDDGNDTEERLEECVTHKLLNDYLFKQLNIGIEFSDTRQGKYARTPRSLAAYRRYTQTKKGKEVHNKARKKYRETENGKAVEKRYNNSEARKTSKQRYRESEKGRAAKERELEKRKAQRLVNKAVSRIRKGMCLNCSLKLTECTNKVHQENNKMFIELEKQMKEDSE